MDVQSVMNWTVVGQLTIAYLRRSTTGLVYRSDHRQALSTARCCRAGQLATTDTCLVNGRYCDTTVFSAFVALANLRYINALNNNNNNNNCNHTIQHEEFFKNIYKRWLKRTA